MARGHGRILTSIWEDEDFLALTEQQQRMYLFLISQPNLNHAGLLPLTLKRWARKARGLTVADVEKTLGELADLRFVVVDDDSEELLIRTFVRNDGVWRQPKVMAAMVSGAQEISSQALRRALLAEMGHLPLEDLSDEPGARGVSVRQQIVEHLTNLRRALHVPDPTPPQDPSRRGSDTPSEGFPKGSESLPDTPSEPTTRGRAPTSRAHSPAPAPAPIPSPIQDGSAEADDPAGLLVVTDSDFVGATEAAPEEAEPVHADAIVAEWLERCAKRPPSNVIGRVGKQIKKLLDDDIDPDDIRRGLARWMAKGADPSSIPSFVNEAMNAGPAHGSSNVIALASGQPLPGTDTTVSGWAALAAALDTGDSA